MKKQSDFDWDANKDKGNQEKHGVSFALAQLAFLDPDRISLKIWSTVLKRIAATVLVVSLTE